MKLRTISQDRRRHLHTIRTGWYYEVVESISANCLWVCEIASGFFARFIQGKLLVVTLAVQGNLGTCNRLESGVVKDDAIGIGATICGRI